MPVSVFCPCPFMFQTFSSPCGLSNKTVDWDSYMVTRLRKKEIRGRKGRETEKGKEKDKGKQKKRRESRGK